MRLVGFDWLGQLDLVHDVPKANETEVFAFALDRGASIRHGVLRYFSAVAATSSLRPDREARFLIEFETCSTAPRKSAISLPTVMKVKPQSRYRCASSALPATMPTGTPATCDL